MPPENKWYLKVGFSQENSLFHSACNFKNNRTLKFELLCTHINVADLNQDVILLFFKACYKGHWLSKANHWYVYEKGSGSVICTYKCLCCGTDFY